MRCGVEASANLKYRESPEAAVSFSRGNADCGVGLAVESQEVVRFKAGAADRWSMVEATMRPVPVVVVKPGKKLVMALLRVQIGPGISPFAESGLDETFGFAVGARGIGTSEVVAQPQFNKRQRGKRGSDNSGRYR
jgi:hypothetical protein